MSDAPSQEQPAAAEGADAKELAALEGLYEAGNFREVNARARVLAERAADEAIRKRAQDLHGRVQLDPFVLWVWAATVLVVAGIVYFYVLR